MSPSFRFLVLLWLALAGSMGSPCLAWGASIAPRGEVKVRRAAVRLSDVFTGVSAAEDADIAQAPPPCRQEVYDVRVLARLADKYDLDWKPKSLADHVVVTSACTRISASQIASALRKAVRDSGAYAAKDDLDIVFDNHSLEIDLSAGTAPDLAINNLAYDPVSKYFRADIVVESPSGPYSVPVTGHVSAKRRVPVLAARLEAGTVIGKEDIAWMDMPEERINPSVILDADQLIGREVRRDTDGGNALHSNDIMPLQLITRGRPVTLEVETPFMTLTATGKALQDGAKGDVVRILNLQSNRVIEGIAESDGVVRVPTAEKMAEAQ